MGRVVHCQGRRAAAQAGGRVRAWVVGGCMGAGARAPPASRRRPRMCGRTRRKRVPCTHKMLVGGVTVAPVASWGGRARGRALQPAGACGRAADMARERTVHGKRPARGRGRWANRRSRSKGERPERWRFWRQVRFEPRAPCVFVGCGGWPPPQLLLARLQSPDAPSAACRLRTASPRGSPSACCTVERGE